MPGRSYSDFSSKPQRTRSRFALARKKVPNHVQLMLRSLKGRLNEGLRFRLQGDMQTAVVGYCKKNDLCLLGLCLWEGEWSQGERMRGGREGDLWPTLVDPPAAAVAAKDKPTDSTPRSVAWVRLPRLTFSPVTCSVPAPNHLQPTRVSYSYCHITLTRSVRIS